MEHIAAHVAGIYAKPATQEVIPKWHMEAYPPLQNLARSFSVAAKALSKGAKPDATGLSNKCLNSMTEATTDLLSRIASAPNAQPESWKMHRDACFTKKGERQSISNYRLLSIAPLMARYTSSAFGRQVMPVLESFFGDHQHGFRKGHSTVSLLHILEAVIHTATTTKHKLP